MNMFDEEFGIAEAKLNVGDNGGMNVLKYVKEYNLLSSGKHITIEEDYFIVNGKSR